MTDNEIQDAEKKYGHLLVVAFCLSLLLIVLICALASHWFNQRLLSDFWPVDKATVAPNILASVIIFDVVTLCAALFYPPFKHALDRGLSKHTAVITSHISKENKTLHAKIDITRTQGEDMTKKMDKRFEDLHTKIDAQHLEHMDALKPKPVPAKKVAKKAAPVKAAKKR
jgi:hypothetical protein